ncbi:ethionine resistance protein [Coemansia javaensis]|uniref:Ethionine resistance protein n=1 Tax=Coemansia javaensis TaxID=2761396 RepID=A0A9W8HJE1_9FUNG|nr:ethionine resistance protein [Coemansia javaensis]
MALLTINVAPALLQVVDEVVNIPAARQFMLMIPYGFGDDPATLAMARRVLEKAHRCKTRELVVYDKASPMLVDMVVSAPITHLTLHMASMDVLYWLAYDCVSFQALTEFELFSCVKQLIIRVGCGGTPIDGLKEAAERLRAAAGKLAGVLALRFDMASKKRMLGWDGVDAADRETDIQAICSDIIAAIPRMRFMKLILKRHDSVAQEVSRRLAVHYSGQLKDLSILGPVAIPRGTEFKKLRRLDLDYGHISTTRAPRVNPAELKLLCLRDRLTTSAWASFAAGVHNRELMFANLRVLSLESSPPAAMPSFAAQPHGRSAWRLHFPTLQHAHIHCGQGPFPVLEWVVFPPRMALLTINVAPALLQVVDEVVNIPAARQFMLMIPYGFGDDPATLAMARRVLEKAHRCKSRQLVVHDKASPTLVDMIVSAPVTHLSLNMATIDVITDLIRRAPSVTALSINQLGTDGAQPEILVPPPGSGRTVVPLSTSITVLHLGRGSLERQPDAVLAANEKDTKIHLEDKQGPMPAAGPRQGIPGSVGSGIAHVGNAETTPLLHNSPSAVSLEAASHGEAGHYLAVARGEARWMASASSLPVLTLLLQASFHFVSVISVGYLGATELAAMALAVTLFGVLVVAPVTGLLATMGSLCSAAFAASGDRTLVGVHLQRGLAAVAVHFALVAPAMWNAERILLAIGQEPAVAQLSGTYLRIQILGVVPWGAFEACTHYLRAQGITNAGAAVSAAVAPIHWTANYLLVRSPTHGVGFAGAPIATVTTQWLSLFGVFVYIRAKQATETWGGWDVRVLRTTGELYRVAAPSVVATWVWWCGCELLTLGSSYFGTAQLAASAVMLSTVGLASQIGNGLGSSAGPRVGSLVGAAKPRQARIAGDVSLAASAVVGAACSLCLAVFGSEWIAIYTKDPAVAREAARLLPAACMLLAGGGLGAVLRAVLRGVGRPGAIAVAHMVGHGACGAPTAYYLGFRRGMGAAGVWWGLAAGVVLSATVQLVYCYARIDWRDTARRRR